MLLTLQLLTLLTGSTLTRSLLILEAFVAKVILEAFVAKANRGQTLRSVAAAPRTLTPVT